MKNSTILGALVAITLLASACGDDTESSDGWPGVDRRSARARRLST